MKGPRIAILVGIIVFLGVCLFPPFFVEVPFYLAVGWASFLWRVGSEVRIDWVGVATGVFCLALFSAGLHRMLAWLFDQMRAADAPMSRRWSPRWTASLVAILLLMFLAGIATTGMAHQVAWLVTSKDPLADFPRTAARRAQSANNLKQMGLGLYQYEGQAGTLPAGGTFDDQGRPLHGWQTMILPYYELPRFYDAIDLTIPWDAPGNAKPFRHEVTSYLNPGVLNSSPMNEAGYALSHYSGNVRVLGGNVPHSFEFLSDGRATTIIAGEVAGGFKPWGDPTNWRDPATGINRSASGFGSPFKGGADFLFADGSAKFLKDTINPQVLKALSTPNGGEPLDNVPY